MAWQLQGCHSCYSCVWALTVDFRKGHTHLVVLTDAPPQVSGLAGPLCTGQISNCGRVRSYIVVSYEGCVGMKDYSGGVTMKDTLGVAMKDTVWSCGYDVARVIGGVVARYLL